MIEQPARRAESKEQQEELARSAKLAAFLRNAHTPHAFSARFPPFSQCSKCWDIGTIGVTCSE